MEGTPSEIQETFWEAVSEIGWTLERIRLGFDPARVRRAGLLAVEAEAYLFYRDALRENPGGFSAQLRSMLEYAEVAPAWKPARSYQILDEVRRRMAGLASADHHLLALPTTPQPPVSLTEPEPAHLGDLTAFVNAAGACAVSIPVLSVTGGPGGTATGWPSPSRPGPAAGRSGSGEPPRLVLRRPPAAHPQSQRAEISGR